MTKSSKQGYKRKIKKLGHTEIMNGENKKLTKVQASRETRKRKNVYMGLLEKKLQQKEKQIIQTKKQLQQIRRQKGIKDSNFYSNLKQRTELFEKISQSIHSQDQYQTKIYLQMLRNKMGVAGKDRENMLAMILRQFTELMMPMHLRYLIQACEEKKEFYELFTENSDYKVHMNFSFLQQTEKKQLSQIRPLLCTYKQSYKHILKQISSLYQVVVDQNQLTQDVIDNLQKAFKPCFVAQFLIKLDQKRNQSQLGSIFPVNYLEIAMRKQKQRARQKKLNEVFGFSVTDVQQIPLQVVFQNAQDDFDYLL